MDEIFKDQFPQVSQDTQREDDLLNKTEGYWQLSYGWSGCYYASGFLILSWQCFS